MPDVNFGELLGVQVDSAERPKTFPTGNYSAVVIGHETGTSSKKGTPFVRFNPVRFRQTLIESGYDNLMSVRVTIDYRSDVIGVSQILAKLDADGRLQDFHLADILEVWKESPGIREILGGRERDLARTQIMREEGLI